MFEVKPDLNNHIHVQKQIFILSRKYLRIPSLILLSAKKLIFNIENFQVIFRKYFFHNSPFSRCFQFLYFYFFYLLNRFVLLSFQEQNYTIRFFFCKEYIDKKSKSLSLFSNHLLFMTKKSFLLDSQFLTNLNHLFVIQRSD